MSDEERGRALAELGRQFLLWLRDNELPGLPGLKPDADFTADYTPHFALLAGVYRRVAGGKGKSLLPIVVDGEAAQNRRLIALGIGVSHVVVFGNPEDIAQHPTLGYVPGNLIVPVDGMPLERTGALQVLAPQLDSLEANQKTLSLRPHLDFTSIVQRTDLVWDDAKAAKEVGFKYLWLFDYETPRDAYAVNVRDIDPPEELADNDLDEQARQFRRFIDHLRGTSTYTPKKYKYTDDSSGDYYPKWRAARPSKREREFTPARLSDDYLKYCLLETMLKRGEDYLYLSTRWHQFIYRFAWEPTSKTAASRKLVIGDPVWVLTSPTAPPDAKPEIERPVTGVIFHALEGSDHLPGTPSDGKLQRYKSVSGRFTIDYKAYLRWYFDDERLDIGSDEKWLAAFVDVFFADATYPISIGARAIDRERLFLGALRKEAEDSEGPLKTNLQDMIARYEAEPQAALLVQGEMVGQRQIIGVTYRGDYPRDVFEFNPNTGSVTRMGLHDWLEYFEKQQLALEIYRNTAGMIPLMMLITWGAVGFLGAAIVAPGALGLLARSVVRQIASELAARGLTKAVLRKLAPQLIAAIADGLLALLPKTDTLPFEFLRGLLHGFGAGTVRHYLSQFDERLERGARTLYKAALNKVTKGIYRLHLVYQRISAAIRKLMGLYKALKVVWTDERARLAAEALNTLGRYVGLAFLIILFVVVYLDYVYRSSRKGDALDEWVRKQRDALVWMVRKTGDDIADHARDLRKELIGNTSTPDTVRERNEKLSSKLVDAAREGIAAVPAAVEILRTLLAEMGIDNWEELKQRGILQLLSDGFEAVWRLQPGLTGDEARAIGNALGELIGGIALGRKLVPKELRKRVGLFRGHPAEKALKQALDDGTLRGLWRLAKAPIGALRDVLPRMVHGIQKTASEHHGMFVEAQKRDTSYRGFLRDLFDDYGELVKWLGELAMDEGLEGRIRGLVGVDELPPDIESLLKTDNPQWPRDAVLFVLATWLHVGLRQLLEAFAVIEDSAPYGGQFRLAQILEIIGLDVALDDETVTALKTTFLRTA